MKHSIFLLAVCIEILFSETVFAQINPTPASERLKSLEERNLLEKNSVVNNIEFKNIGPTIMSARVTDIDVNPSNPFEFYVAYASGGLWYTNNNGGSFTPLFDNEHVITIGDIAVDWSSGIIYVGTGEVNSSRSSYAGIGMYKSADKGKTWVHIGLPESHHIGAITLHPNNPDIVWVAVLGHLYSPNKERGIYKTTDGGITWKQVLFINENTGGIELSMDAKNPEVLYAATWYRERRAWNLVEAGSGSGIYKSIDGGNTWQLLNSPESGFPFGEGVGRIGIAVSASNTQIVYAVVDNHFPRAEEIKEKDTSIYVLEDFKNITKEKFLALDNVKLDKFLKENRIPEEYSAQIIKGKVASGEFRPTVINEYLNLGDYVFNLPIKGCEVYRSNDAGKTWAKTHDYYLDDIYYTYGYYFGKIHVSPINPNRIIIYGVPLLLSDDGGKTWKSIDSDNMHVDYHALWFNPTDDNHIIVGNDGGLNISYDGGSHWDRPASPPVGQFYTVEVDDATPYNVYGGLQDNGIWFGSSDYSYSSAWEQYGKYPYTNLYGGDGMQVQVDTRDNKTVYLGYQFGYYARINTETEDELFIRPRHKFGEYPLRFNWQTPIWLSRHNRDILYYGSNRFHRSLEKGENLETLSNDLTTSPKQGDVPFGTITSICESPLRFGLLYCGTDDGKVHISSDGGYSWKDISKGLPEGLWVSRVWASSHNEGKVYVALNGYRNDHFKPYVFSSDNYGATWSSISGNLPYEPVNVVKDDPSNNRIVYVGTDNGLYVSLNGGSSYMSFGKNLPRVPVHDLTIHHKAKDIIIGTHGRSIYKADLEEIQLLNDSILNSDFFAFKVKDKSHNAYQGKKYWAHGEFVVDSIALPFYSKGEVIIKGRIYNETDQQLYSFADTTGLGINYFRYPLLIDSAIAEDQNSRESDSAKQWLKADNGLYYLLPGKYYCEWSGEGGVLGRQTFSIIE